MATLNLTTKEFADVAMIWLFDQVMNPEQVKNEIMKEFIKEHKGKLKAPLMAYYFDTGMESRYRYRRISGAFDGSDLGIHQIRISPDKELKKKVEKEGKLKKLAKTVIKKVLNREELNMEDVNILKEISDDNNEILVERES